MRPAKYIFKVLWFRAVFALFHKVLNLEKVEDYFYGKYNLHFEN